jgi:MFS family permease
MILQKNLTALYLATFISGLGTGTLLVMLNWILIQKYESSTIIGILTAASYLSCAFILPKFSIWLDRFEAKNLLLKVYLFGGFFQLVIIILIILGVDLLLGIVISIIISVLIRMIDQMARLVIAQKLVDKDEYRSLSRHLEVLRQAITLGAGLLVAFFIEKMEMKTILILDGFSFIVGAYFLSLINVSTTESGSIKTPKSKCEKSLKSTYDYFCQNPYFFLVLSLSLSPYISVLAQNAIHPAHVDQLMNMGGEYYAFMGAFFGVGAVLSPFVSRKLHCLSFTKERIILTGLIGYLIANIIIVIEPNIYSTYFCLFLFAISHSVIRIERLAFIMEYTPQNIIGKVSGSFEMIGLIGVVIVTSLVGFMSDRVSVASAWLFMAVFILLSLLSLLYYVYKNNKESEPIHKIN